MSSIKVTVLGLCLAAFLAGCAKKAEDVVYVDQPAVTTEPVYTGKYK